MITTAEVSPSAVHRPWNVSPEAYLQWTKNMTKETWGKLMLI